MQRFARLARYWDLVANSGRFKKTLVLLLQPVSPFDAFLEFSDWLWQTTGKTSGLTPEALVDCLFDYLTKQRLANLQSTRDALLADYQGSGARGNPATIQLTSVKAQRRPAPVAAILTHRQRQHSLL
jgi:Protein of unknown function (DUF4080)